MLNSPTQFQPYATTKRVVRKGQKTSLICKILESFLSFFSCRSTPPQIKPKTEYFTHLGTKLDMGD